MKNTERKNAVAYGYYSKILQEPFDSVEELTAAEEAYYAKMKAKEDKAAQKKADALAVEDAFKALNTARKNYKTNLNAVTDNYREAMTKLKNAFETDAARVKAELAAAEDAYKLSLKVFAEKYPEGYHITLKDGDFETTISSGHSAKRAEALSDIWDLLSFFHF